MFEVTHLSAGELFSDRGLVQCSSIVFLAAFGASSERFPGVQGVWFVLSVDESEFCFLAMLR